MPVSGRRSLPVTSDPDVLALRHVRLRLAVLTVGMLLALVVAIALVVYLSAQSVMEQSLRDLVRNGAQRQVGQFRDAFSPAEHDVHRRPAPEVGEQQNGIFITFADRTAAYLGGDARQFGTTVPDSQAVLRAVHTDRAAFSSGSYKGQHYLYYTVPVSIAGRVDGAVQAAASTRQYDQSVRDLLEVLLSAGGLGLLASAAITLVLVRRALSPIRRSLTRQRDFVADAAHELRTPLTILRSAVELGLGSPDAREQQEALTQALMESRHLGRLIDDLALLARADSGAQTLDLQSVALDRLVIDTVQAIAMLAEDRNIAITTQIDSAVHVTGDYGRLRQLLLILLDNALKHTPAGEEILVRLDRAGGKVRLTVRDAGPGINAGDLPHVFDRFYRAQGQRSVDGGGLGLAIALWIVRSHGGQILAANAAPHGAVFTTTLPLEP